MLEETKKTESNTVTSFVKLLYGTVYLFRSPRDRPDEGEKRRLRTCILQAKVCVHCISKSGVRITDSL